MINIIVENMIYSMMVVSVLMVFIHNNNYSVNAFNPRRYASSVKTISPQNNNYRTQSSTTTTTFIFDNIQKQSPLNSLNDNIDNETEASMVMIIPSIDELAKSLSVRPQSKLPRKIWKLSWYIHGKLLPLLHIFDDSNAKDLDKSLKVLWCKAIYGCDVSSPVYDNNIAYDMLPSFTRRLVTLIPSRFYPRLIHTNVEIRTAYIDQMINQEIKHAKENNKRRKIRLITLGAGYDTRSIKFLTNNNNNNDWINEAWECDLPQSIEIKNKMLQRFHQRRPECKLPNQIEIDLNDMNGTKKVYSNIILSSLSRNQQENIKTATNESSSSSCYYTIVILEGVMMYLNKGIPNKLLTTIAHVTKELSGAFSCSLIFADLLENVSNDQDYALAKSELSLNGGWELIDWKLKPGAARQMGVARI